MMNLKDSKWQFYLADFGESKILSEEMMMDSKTLSSKIILLLIMFKP